MFHSQLIRNGFAQKPEGTVEILIPHHQPARQKTHASVHDTGMGIKDHGLYALLRQDIGGIIQDHGIKRLQHGTHGNLIVKTRASVAL